MSTLELNSAGQPVYYKDPNARKDYGRDWTDWLAGDTIVASVWVVPAGLVHNALENSFTGTVTALWLSGGTAGKRYLVTNRITTAAGRIEDRSIEIVCRQQ